MTFDDIKKGSVFRIGYDRGVWITVTAKRLVTSRGRPFWECVDASDEIWTVDKSTFIKEKRA